MKVIGLIEENRYICEVSHTEIEKFLNMYYGNENLNEMKVGTEINLGKGHDFMREIKSAVGETQKFLKLNKEIIKSITDGINIINTED